MFASPAYLSEPDRVWEQSNCASALRALFDAAGMEWVTPHTLRRSVATILSRGHASVLEVASELGHGDLAQAMKYIQKDFAGDKSALAALL